ncbi:MAG TPA: hypothetical protein VNT20_15105 [Flavisolibacter sp.]|nr:hypothetical protein [Flavisolibacter sp.]
MNRFYSFITLMLLSSVIFAQDTLPKFTVTNAGPTRNIVGWVNNYGMVKQISVQRSFDSLSNFKTILSVADPNSRQNGFADTKAPSGQMFYRLFVVLGPGQFYFTASKRAQVDSFRLTKNGLIDKTRDSVSIGIKPGIPRRNDFIPSFYVYTNKDGYLFINLPDAEKKKYHIKFYEEDDTFLFELKNVKDPALTLDKTNFMHAGWFKFELYNDEKLVEKNKFYLAKEF